MSHRYTSSNGTPAAMKRSKEILKDGLKLVGLYRCAVWLYCLSVAAYARARNFGQLLQALLSNAWFRRRNAADGLPFPPVRLVYLVTNKYMYEWFCNSGLIGSNCIRQILKRHDYELTNFEAILDFGCGCGRVIRHWKGLFGPKLYGSDYNPVLVEWCKANLTCAEFSVNHIESGLHFENGTFDFVYAICVFTHLTEEMGRFWMTEIQRILKPGGILYVTFMGPTRAAGLPKDLREQFENGQFIVMGADKAGKNTCAAFHPEQYVREVLATGFDVLDFIPGGAMDAVQDVFLLRKLPDKSPKQQLADLKEVPVCR